MILSTKDDTKPEHKKREERVSMILSAKDEAKQDYTKRLRVDSASNAGLLGALGGKPQISKKVEVDGKDLSVSIILKNPSGNILKNVSVVDVLPNDASDFKVLTSGVPFERSEKKVVWNLSALNRNDKRIVHYHIKSQEKNLPKAVLEWDE